MVFVGEETCLWRCPYGGVCVGWRMFVEEEMRRMDSGEVMRWKWEKYLGRNEQVEWLCQVRNFNMRVQVRGVC